MIAEKYINKFCSTLVTIKDNIPAQNKNNILQIEGSFRIDFPFKLIQVCKTHLGVMCMEYMGPNFQISANQ